MSEAQVRRGLARGAPRACAPWASLAVLALTTRALTTRALTTRAPTMRALTTGAAIVGVVACGAGRASDPRVEEADRASLRGAVAADAAVADALARADDLVVRRRGREALDLLEREAAPKARANAAAAAAAPVASPWGIAQAGAVRALLDARVAAVDGYLDALRADDAERVLGQLERRVELERRSGEIAARLAEAPPRTQGCGG